MKLLLLVAAFLAVASAYDVFYFSTTDKQEVVYKYYADVVTGTKDPAPYGSKFALRGDLHIRDDKSGNGTVFWLNNVEVFAYNGENFFGVKPVWTPIPELATAYLTPFYVGYTEAGLAEEVFFQQGEPEWVFNVKKAIASTFQLDFAGVTKYVKKVPYAFQTYEDTIYGRCHVSYEVVPYETEYKITKYLNPRSCEGFVEMKYTNLVSHQCFADHDDTFSTVAERHFTVTKEGVIRDIKAEYMAFGYIFKLQENTQVISVTQNFTYVDYVQPTTEIDFTKFVTYYPIIYTSPSFSKSIPDLSFGFYEVEKDHYVKHVQELLVEAVEYMESLTVDTKVPTLHDVKEGRVINRLYYVMRMFEVAEYEQVFNFFYKSNDKKQIRALEFFYKILPNIGTYYSAAFIRDLIAHQKVKDYVATQLLNTLGVNFPYVGIDYLADFEVFYQWDMPTEVKHASILTFSTMVHKAFQDTPHDARVEKYIKFYYNQLKIATTYSEQVIWLHGLSNIRVGSVYDLIRPIVFGDHVLDHSYDRHLRVQAVWSLMHVMEDMHVDVFETFWPLLVDETLHFELRVAALKGIIYLGDVSELRYVFQWIQDHHNIHLYNFFYHTVRDVAHSKIQCDQRANRTIFFEQMEQHFADYPVAVGTSAFVQDVYDEETGFGFYVYGNTIANEKTNKVNQIYFRMSEVMSHEMFNNFGVSIKFEGIEYPLENLMSDFFTFTVDTFKGKYFKKTGEPIHVEIIVSYHDQIVYTKYFDDETIEKLFNLEFLNLVSLFKFRFMNTFFTMQKEVYFPTDLGMTATFHTQVPFVLYFNSEVPFFKAGTELSIKYESKLRFWSHADSGMSVHNPLAAMVQGVRRVYALDVNVPFNFDLEVNFDDHKITVRSHKQKDDLYNVAGLKTYTTTQAFVYTDRRIDVLKQTCEKCQHTVAATQHTEKLNYNTTLFESHNRFNGLRYYAGIYDAEYAAQDFKQFDFPVGHLDFHIFEHFGDYKFGKYLMNAYSWLVKNAYIYPRGNFGFAMFSSPCKVYPSDEWEWTTVINRVAHSKDPRATFLDYSNTINMTVVTKNLTGEIVTSYDMDFAFDHFHGQIFNNFFAHFAKKFGEEDTYYNFCFQRTKDYQSSRVNFDYDIWYGESTKHECVKDDMYVRINGYAEKSEEQLSEEVMENPQHTYSACRPHLPWQRATQGITYQCALASSSFRRYHYTVQYTDVPTTYSTYFRYLKHYLITKYEPQIKLGADKDHFSFAVADSFDVDFVYPVDFHEQSIKMIFTFPHETYAYDHFPVQKFGIWAYPENYYFPTIFQFAKEFNHYDACMVFPTETKFYVPHVKVPAYPTSEEWTLYAANAPTNYTWAAYVKKFNEHDMAVKFVFNEGWVIVKPIVEEMGISNSHTYNKSLFSVTTSDKFFKYFATEYSGSYYNHVQMWHAKDTILFTLPDYGMIWKFNGKSLFVFNIDTEHQYHGRCYEH